MVAKYWAGLAAAFVSICTAAPSNANGLGLLIAEGLQEDVSASNVVAFPTATGQFGRARLFRSFNAVSVDVVTSGLDPSRIYSVWWVVFNNPSACVNASNAAVTPGQRCDGGDLANANTRPGLIWASAGPAGAGGIATFSATLPVDDASSNIPNPALTTPLRDTTKAEIHVVVRRHEAAGAGGKDPFVQITTFEGACAECGNVQFSVHPAPSVRRPH